MWEGDHVRIGLSEELVTCGGTFPAIDDFATVLREELGFASTESRATIFWLDGDEFAQVPCPGTACTRDATVYASVLPINHETVHVAYNQELGRGNDPIVFFEGIAEHYGDDIPFPSPSDDIAPLLLQTAGHLRNQDYPRVGHFVTFVVERHGIEQYNEFMIATHGRRDPEFVAERFEGIFGDALSDAVDMYSSYPGCSRNNWREPILECDGEPMPWGVDASDQAEWILTTELDCEDEATIGPRFGIVWTTRVLEIPEDGDYRFSQTFRIEGPGDVSVVKFVGCEATCEEPFELVLGDRSPIEAAQTVHARAGRYYVQLERRADVDVEVTAAVRRVEM